MAVACSIRVRGVVQGVGFRPFVYRLAHAHTLNGWVLNAEDRSRDSRWKVQRQSCKLSSAI